MRANRQTKRQICDGIVGEHTGARVIANNTVQYTNSKGEIVIRLHNTDIITYKKNGSVVLNTDGWQTPTTKERLNRYMSERHIRIEQKNHKWTVNGVPFVDGIEIRKDGTIPQKWAKKADSKIKRDMSVEKKIEKYLKIVKKKLSENDTLPSSGDCFFCSMHTVDDGIALGDATNDHSHIEMHLKEGYVPNSLLWNAMKEAGYKAEVYLHPEWRKGREMAWMNQVVVRNVRKYIRRRMNIAI